MAITTGGEPPVIGYPFAEGTTERKTFSDEDAGSSIDIRNGLKEILEKPLFTYSGGRNHKGNGSAINREDVNGLFNLVTQMPFYLQSGGLFSFDTDFCNRINGYPKGAILMAWKDGFMFHVRSLKEHNHDNFVQNPGFINGISWTWCEESIEAFPDYSNKMAIQGLDDGTRREDGSYRFTVSGTSKKTTSDPIDSFEGKGGAIPTDFASVRKFRVNRGWLYMSTTYDLSKKGLTNTPDNAFITVWEGSDPLSDTDTSSANEKSIRESIASTAYWNKSLKHQCYAWSLQIMIRQPSWIQVWTGSSIAFDMYCSNLGFKGSI